MLQHLLGTPMVRRAVDAVFGIYARSRVRHLDRLPLIARQEATLLSLIRRARGTRFGREHGFEHIGSVKDFQDRVPLRDYEKFWQQYWQPTFPNLKGVTWPGAIPYFALSSGTTSGTTKYIPVSREMLASNQRAALTSLAFFLAKYPRTPIFRGRMFFLGGSTDLTVLDPRTPILAGDLSGIAAREVSSLLRPFTYPPLDVALIRNWEEKVRILAEQSAKLPITLVGGVPSWLLFLFERVLQATGRSHIADVWPTLRVIIHGGTKFDPYSRRLANIIATEDLRHQGLLRLLPDHGLFFEFVPVEELGTDRPTRHTVADLEPGVNYAVVLTTCAGLWGYVIGDTVRFAQRDPPLLQFTGRTRYFLSAFGEHLISEEVERAIAKAAEGAGVDVVEFHVGPLFPETAGVPGRHRYLVEFTTPPADIPAFVRSLDAELCRLNEDYAAHRAGNLTMLAPEVLPVRSGGFAEWMRAHGKLGGQHKVPRMDNSGEQTQAMTRWFVERDWIAQREGVPCP
jgi:GH3 auxin-responsive promoter